MPFFCYSVLLCHLGVPAVTLHSLLHLGWDTFGTSPSFDLWLEVLLLGRVTFAFPCCRAALKWGRQESTTAPWTSQLRCSHARFWSKNTQCRTTIQKWVFPVLLQHWQMLPALLGSAWCWFLPAERQRGSSGCSVFSPSSSSAGNASSECLQPKHPLHSPGSRESRSFHLGGFSWAGWVPLPPNPPSCCSVRIVLKFPLALYCPASCRRALLSFFLLLTLSARLLSRQAMHF